MIKINEYVDFLRNQRGQWKMYMTVEDKELVKKQERILQRQKKRMNADRKQELQPIHWHLNQIQSLNALVMLVRSLSRIQTDDYEVRPIKTTITKPDKDSTRQLFTTQVTSALDHNKISDG